MGRKQGDPVAAGGTSSSSSIALLQERFRQLQKMRERREEMELLKLFSESETMSQTKRSGNLLVHPETISNQPINIMTTRSSFQDSLSLGLDLYTTKTEQKPSKTPYFGMDSVTNTYTSRAHDKPDVDTSLHL